MSGGPPIPDCEILPHPTDLRVRVRARDRRTLFEQVARATFAMCARPRGEWPAALTPVELELAGRDDAELVKRIAAECLFLFESRGFLGREAEVRSTADGAVSLRLRGARFAADALQVQHVIKAVTWHGLSVRAEGDGLTAEILFDL